MKRILVFLLLLSPFCLSAQEVVDVQKPKFEPGHEVKIGWGYMPLNRGLFACDCVLHMNGGGMEGIGSSITNPSTFYGEKHNIGAFVVAYTYRFKKWFELSATLSYASTYHREYKNLTGERVGTEMYHMINIMPTAKFNYYNNGLLTLHGSVSAGLSFDTAGYPFPTFNLNYFGLSLGQKVYWYFDLSVGNLGLISTGLGVRI